MPRIVDLIPAPGLATGGNKVAFRHVEALIGLGYEAVVRVPGGRPAPTWFTHDALVERATGRPDRLAPSQTGPAKVQARFPERAALAQPVEHRIRNAGVRCSSHLGGTTGLPASHVSIGAMFGSPLAMARW